MAVSEWVSEWSHSVVSNSLQPYGLYPARLFHPWEFPGKNTGVGWHFLLQGIFQTQRQNPGLLHCHQTLYHLKVKVKSCSTLCNPMDSSLPDCAVRGIFQARILEWAAISSSSGSSQPRDRTRVSCIADRCFTVWATREWQSWNQTRSHRRYSGPHGTVQEVQ